MSKLFLKNMVILVLVGLLISACQSASTVVLTPAVESLPDTILVDLPTLTLVPTMATLPTVTPATSPVVAPTRTILPSPEPAWTYDVGAAIWSSPTISENVIYFGSDNGNLYAVDLQTGQLRWKFTTGGFVRSRPAIADESVYFTSDDGYLYALRSDSGTELWRADIGAGNMPDRENLTGTWDYQQSSPVVLDATVYVGSGASAIFAIDAATGARIWKFDTVGPVRGTPAVAGETVFVGDKLAFLYALDVESGAEKWRVQGCDIPSPLVVDGIVYCGSRATTDLRAWDARTGELLWKFSFQGSWVESSPRISDGILYIGSSDATALFAIDPKTGAQMWKFSTGDYAWCTPAISNRVVYIGSFSTWRSASNFYAVDATTGEPIWVLAIPNGVVSSPVVENEVVYFGGLDGRLYAVRTSPE